MNAGQVICTFLAGIIHTICSFEIFYFFVSFPLTHNRKFERRNKLFYVSPSHSLNMEKSKLIMPKIVCDSPITNEQQQINKFGDDLELGIKYSLTQTNY